MPAPCSQDVLRLRGAILAAVRGFFSRRDFIEVETPVRIPAPALELHIDAEPSGGCYLRTSPELHMKRLLAAGMSRVFQAGPCFRRGERGRLHSPEFTMLEWYRADADYHDVLADAGELVASVAREVLGRTVVSWQGQTVELAPPWERLTVRDAFVLHAGWDPLTGFDADRFDLDLVERVEPALPRGRPVVLMDYPVEAAALARCRPSLPPVAERWELYIAGLEVANAFSELTDAAEQRRRFVECAARRAAAGSPVYPLDEPFLEAMEAGMPACAGVALGLDRLVMLLADRPSVAEVRAFVE